MPVIAEAIAEGANRLRDSAIADDRRTAGVLLSHALGVDRAYLLTRSKESVDEALYQEYLRFVERRANGEPLQYITGHQEFYGRDFIVTPDVLIPRPETESLVERVINLAQDEDAGRLLQKESNHGPLIVDVGTGSGCIAITLAAEIANARLLAIDVSGAAIDIARKNAERIGVAERVEFIESDLLAPLTGRNLEGAIDFIASNPPYVEAARTELVQREVREWEPHVALFGGADGLDFYRRLTAEAPAYLKYGGYLVVEIGYSQLNGVRQMIEATTLELVDVTSDLQGIPRTVTSRKS